MHRSDLFGVYLSGLPVGDLLNIIIFIQNLYFHGFRLKLWKIRFGGRDSPPPLTSNVFYVNICVAKGCESILNAHERYHLHSRTHSSGVKWFEYSWQSVFTVAEHGRITQLHEISQKSGKP